MGQIIYLHTSEFQVEVGQILGSTVDSSLFVQIQLSATIYFERDLGTVTTSYEVQIFNSNIKIATFYILNNMIYAYGVMLQK